MTAVLEPPPTRKRSWFATTVDRFKSYWPKRRTESNGEMTIMEATGTGYSGARDVARDVACDVCHDVTDFPPTQL